MIDLIQLSKSSNSICVRPRLPYRKVFIAPQALEALQAAQGLLGNDVKLVLTRGFENSGCVLRALHRVGRLLGAILFRIVYPGRASEIKDIFCPNGHDLDGTHIDVSVIAKGQLKRLLPFGVFTSRQHAAKIRDSEKAWLPQVYKALEQCGFRIHPNLTESLQIHCDLMQR
jgi:hypothetical protein